MWGYWHFVHLVSSGLLDPTLRSYVAYVGLLSSLRFSLFIFPTLRSFVAYVGLLALRASCLFGASRPHTALLRRLCGVTELYRALVPSGLLKEYIFKKIHNS